MVGVKRIIYFVVEVILFPLYMVAWAGLFIGCGTWIVDDTIRKWLKQ